MSDVYDVACPKGLAVSKFEEKSVRNNTRQKFTIMKHK